MQAITNFDKKDGYPARKTRSKRVPKPFPANVRSAFENASSIIQLEIRAAFQTASPYKGTSLQTFRNWIAGRNYCGEDFPNWLKAELQQRGVTVAEA